MHFDWKAALIAVVVGGALFVAIWAVDPLLAASVTEEDGHVENATMALFAVSGLVCGYYAFQAKTGLRYYLLLWAGLCFIFWGEEVSWGQHWIGFETPEILASNSQGEANFHNLTWWTPKVVESPGSFLTSQGAFYAGFFTYFLLLPWACRIRPIGRLAVRLQFPRQPATLLVAIWLPLGVSFFLALITKIGPTREALTESRELYFAFAIFLYSLLLARLARLADRTVASTPPQTSD